MKVTMGAHLTLKKKLLSVKHEISKCFIIRGSGEENGKGCIM